MLQAALHTGAARRKAVFELFPRKLPEGRRYGVVAGTERAIKSVESFTFQDEQTRFLADNTNLNQETLDYLANYRFTGTITGYREGELYYPYSPVLTVEGTFGECVILETLLLSIFNHDSAVASAASRMVAAALGTPIIEMGSRRANDKAAVDAARAAYLAGFTATSNLEAGFTYGVPTTGTSAHAFTLAHDTEVEAFKGQVESLGVGTTLLVDTYNISKGIENALEVGGTNLGAVRIDSGDLYRETLKAREQLDDAGARDTRIVLSSDIDEYVIDELHERGIPVDGIGAGTKVVTGSGHPTAGMVYKLVELDGHPVEKNSSGKKSIGGKKYAARTGAEELTQVGDLPEHGRPLQTVYIQDGETIFNPTLEESRAYHKEMLDQLTPEQKHIKAGEPNLTHNHIGGTK